MLAAVSMRRIQQRSDPPRHTVNLAAGTVTGDIRLVPISLVSIEAVRGTHFCDTYNAVGF